VKNLKKYLLIITINLVILLLLIKIVDLFFEEETPDFQLYERELVLTEHPSNADYSVTPPDFRMEQAQNLEQKPYRFRTDAHGLIIGPSDTSNIDAPIDVLFFGGSTTECFFVEEDKRFPYLVGEKLSSETGNKIVVRNAGLMGKHSMKSNFDLMIRGIRLNPDIVVLMHNINDLVQLLYVDSYYDGPLNRRIVTDQKEPGNANGILYTTAFYIKEWLFPNIYKIMSARFQGTEGRADEWEGWRDSSEIDIEALKKQFATSMSTFVSIARANGIEPVLMTQFNRMYMDDELIVSNYYINAKHGIPPEDFFEYYHIFNQLIRETAEKEDVLLIDLATLIPSTSEYMYDAVHLNTTGSVKAADIISDSIKNRFYNSL